MRANKIQIARIRGRNPNQTLKLTIFNRHTEGKEIVLGIFNETKYTVNREEVKTFHAFNRNLSKQFNL